ncbi:sugar transferase, partial [Cribrihabitans sp. XS_ASV171]
MIARLAPAPSFSYEPVPAAANDNVPRFSGAGLRICVPRGLYAGFAKRLFDVFFVLLTLPVAVPIILLCALALKIEGGSAFYTQPRLGRGGRRFAIYKLRTMVP